MTAARRVIHVTVRGRVQGVGFRAWTQHQAELHGLDGWVRNRADGSVEAAFAGAPEAIETMVRTCRTGPGGSQVDGVEVVEAEVDERLRPGRFEVLRTER